jgi:hypothetical protein
MPYQLGPVGIGMAAGADPPRLVAHGRMKIRGRALNVEQQGPDHNLIIQGAVVR